MSDRTAGLGREVTLPPSPPAPRQPPVPSCNRCGFPVITRPWGCKNPCRNCGTVYPLGDCSD